MVFFEFLESFVVGGPNDCETTSDDYSEESGPDSPQVTWGQS